MYMEIPSCFFTPCPFLLSFLHRPWPLPFNSSGSRQSFTLAAAPVLCPATSTDIGKLFNYSINTCSPQFTFSSLKWGLVNEAIIHCFTFSKSKEYYYTPIGMAKIQTKQHQMLEMMWSNRNSHSLLVGRQNRIAMLENSPAVSYKTKHTTSSSKYTPWYLRKFVENLCSRKNLHTSVCRSFSLNCQNMEATKMPSSEWVNK